MATLVSPGVSVMVVDESQYAAATQGTLPLVVVATAANKTDASGSAIAAGTIPANAGVAYLVSSQRELVETFGEPKFYEVGGSVVQGSETSEYGLLAAYQYLGVSNNAYVIRADMDLSQLEASSNEPAGLLTGGTYWHDTDSSVFGLFKHDGTDWVPANPAILNDEPGTGNVELINASGHAAPSNTFGSAGDFAVVTSTARITYWARPLGNWILLGATGSPNFLSFAKFAPTGASGDTYVRLTQQGGGLDLAVAAYNAASGLFQAVEAPAYGSDDLALADLITEGDVYTHHDSSLGIIQLRRHSGATENVLTSDAIADTSSITTVFNLAGSGFSFSGATLDNVISTMQSDTTLNNANVRVEKIGNNRVRFTKTDGKWLSLSFTSGQTDLGFTEAENTASVWEDLSYEASAEQPKGDIAEGTLWFDADLKIEILRNEFNGSEMEWTAYAWSEDSNGLSQAELQLRSGMPTKRKAVAAYNAASGLFQAVEAPAYGSDDLALADLITEGDVYTHHDSSLGIIQLRRHSGATENVLTSDAIADTSSITTVFNLAGSGFSFSGATLDNVISTMQSDTTLNNANVRVEKIGNNRVRFTKTDGKWLSLSFTSGQTDLGFTEAENTASVWEDLSYEASAEQPKGDIAEGTLWFDADLKIEILRNEFNTISSQMEWTKHAWSEDTDGILSTELQLRSGKPTKRKGGTALVADDIWVDSDAMPYPTVYRWNGSDWVKLDNADQSSTNGLVFGHYSNEAPFDANGATNSRTAHAQAPNAELHPENILMVNMDYSTYNVKRWTDGEWVWASGLNLDGSGRFGSEATRGVVVEAMQAALAGNEGIRAESTYFNLIAAPGYPELMDEMITLNKDKKEIAFVIGDAPLTLKSDSTSLKAWADSNLPADAYAGIYYPHGLSTDLSGNDVVIPASAVALRTIAFSDQVSFPWFAPAGLTRGVVSNASQVGYVTDENEFSRVRLTEGQRDVLYTNRMNPIADMPGTGLVVYGQKTLQSHASAMDRINVARLVNYMRFNLDQLSRGFLFEQNDKITRDNMRDAVERFCSGLVINRGLYDFLVVCDETNNTPARIDRNELWVDVAIQPAKSVEFIYIPLRIRNTGEAL